MNWPWSQLLVLALGPEDLLLMLAPGHGGLLLVLALGPEGLSELQGQLTQGLGPVPSSSTCGKTRSIALKDGRTVSTRAMTIDQGVT